MNKQKRRQDNEMKKILKVPSSSSRRSVKHSINSLELGDYYKGTVKIIRKAKPGPLILNIFDGTGTINAVASPSFLSQASRSSQYSKPSRAIEPRKEESNVYSFGNLKIKDSRKKSTQSPQSIQSSSSSSKSNSGENAPEKETRAVTEEDVVEGAIVKIFGKVTMHRDELELEIKSISLSTMNFDSIIEQHSKPHRTTFSFDSERYESMKDRFISIATRIRRAIIEQQPILLRHHNDADGICAGLSVEQSIIHEMGRYNIEPKNRIYRSPSVSPFYDQIDLFRDISKFNRYTNHFGDKSPLVVLLDTGSTPENQFALQVLQSFHFDCIVVDHHNPGPIMNGKSVICDTLQFHLNPYLFGWDSQTSGGMLGYELARFIDEDFDNPLYPAVAGVGDRVEGFEIDKSIELSGKNRDELLNMAKVMDYLAFNFRFDGGEGVYEQVFSNPAMVNLISQKVDSYFQATMDRILPNLKDENLGNVILNPVNLDLYSQRGKYPPPGKILGTVHDYLAKKFEGTPVFSMGYFKDGIIIRATEPVLPVPDLLVELQSEFPDAAVEGGGHEQAGSIKYLESYGEQIRDAVRSKLKKNTSM